MTTIPSVTLHVYSSRTAADTSETMIDVADNATRAAIYCRTSTSQQKIGSQWNACLDHCAKQGYAVVRQYIEEGHSGDAPYMGPRLAQWSGDVWTRPLFKQLLLETVLFRPFDVIVCWSDDRWSRLPPSVDRPYKRLLADRGVRLEFIVPQATLAEFLGECE
jgi:DNA invertase Pin-like site-specific DNA recombinase